MADKNSFIFYAEYVPDLAYLDGEDFKELMFWLSQYQQTGVPPDPESDDVDNTLYCLFCVMSRRIDYDEERYQKAVERNQSNGKKGGRPTKTQDNPEKPKETQRNPKKPKETQDNPEKPNHNPTKPKKSLMDMDMDMDILSSADAEDVYMEPPQPLPDLPDDAPIVSAWNACTVTQKIKGIPFGGKRYDNTRLCIGSDMHGFLSTIQSLDEQEFFMDQKNKGHPVTYDWFVDPNNYQKVIEGNYRKRYQTGKKEGGYIGLERDW